MTPRAATPLLAALLLAGCTLGAQESSPAGAAPSCRDEAEASASAPLLATLQEDPEAVARRLGEAMGANVSGPPEPLPGGDLRWRDGDATLTVTRGEDTMRVAWAREAPWSPDRAEAEATLRRAIEAFAPPDPGAFEVASANDEGAVQLQARQLVEGRPLLGAGASLSSGAHAAVVVDSLREVRPGLELIPEARATEIARAAARCALDQRDETEAAGHAILGTDAPALGAKGASLAWVVDVRVAEQGQASPCGRVERVHVDAVTGKVLGIAPPPCG
ncbi:MAG TPA: hypothetical protein VNX21_06475 [Candidatus Thermoplasmatota archaeon]|nr:hypothetical protein [Candidatus Thermoplasmatota archaeon]